MNSEIYANPVVQYPGIFYSGGRGGQAIVDGEAVLSRTISIYGLGEDSNIDFPGGFQPVHSWILAWAVRIKTLEPIGWLGTAQEWTRLKLNVWAKPAILVQHLHEQNILPLTTGEYSCGASGETRIHSHAAWIEIGNNTGQTQTVDWDVWAKAA